MKLRTLIEAVLPTLLDDLDAYDNYELSLVALTPSGDTAAQSLINIRQVATNNYIVLSTEVQVLESPRQS